MFGPSSVRNWSDLQLEEWGRVNESVRQAGHVLFPDSVYQIPHTPYSTTGCWRQAVHHAGQKIFLTGLMPYLSPRRVGK